MSISFKNILRKRQNRNKLIGLLFISPWIVGFLLFYLRNLIVAVNFSLSELNMLPDGGFSLTFLGLKNYRIAFLEDAGFLPALVKSLQNLLTDVPLIIFFSLFVALILNGKFKGRALVRVIFFLPIIFIIPTVTSALSNTLSSVSEGISSLPADVEQSADMNIARFLTQLTEFGFPENLVNYIIGAVGRIYEIIKASGIQILIFLAALQAIPGSLYEVSEIEGATSYETFWKVTLPLVSPMILINVVYTIVDSYFSSPILRASYNTTFGQMNFGMGAVYAIVGSLLVCAVLVIIGALSSKLVFYQS